MSSPIHLSPPSGSQSEHEDEAELRTMWEQGRIEEGTLYWREGMTDWKPIAELFADPAPPQLSEEPPSIPLTEAPAAPAYSYTKDPRSLTIFLVVMLWVSLGMEVVSMLSDLGQMSLLERDYTQAEGEANNARQSITGTVYFAVFVVTAIGFLKWVHRANMNCRGFGARDMEFTPGWSVGYYFVPFINLVRPYQCMKEIWKVSHDPRDWKSQSGDVLLRVWWTLWIISSIVGQVVYRTSLSATTIDQIKESTGASIVSSLIEIPLCLVALKLVKTIAARQEKLVTDG